MTVKNNTLTQEYLKSILHYDPETGVFTWGETMNNNAIVGSIAGHIECPQQKKYRRIRLKGKSYNAHRLVWLYTFNSWPKNQIDHIDGNGLNNKLDNLRDVTPSENQKNQRLRDNSKSGKLGVFWVVRVKKWQVQINVNKKQIYLGYFSSLKKAIKIREEAEKRYGYHKNHGSIRPL